MIDARELARRLDTSQFAAPCTSEEMAFISKVLRQHAEATDIQGDAEVLKYVTSGNDVPVTRCTVSADLIRQLVRERGEADRSQPQRILDEREVRQVAKETCLPKYFYDTEEGRLDLARFAHNADQYLRSTSTQITKE